VRAPPAGDRRATGGAPKTARRIREAGAAPMGGVLNITAAVWTASFHWWRVLATKSERKMLASTCLYSLYAWFIISCERRTKHDIATLQSVKKFVVILSQHNLQLSVASQNGK